MKILVIDDHPLIQEALKHVLTELDASLELIQAEDASSAHAALSRTPNVDLLVLDLALPGCDGFDLLADLRRDWPGIPVVALLRHELGLQIPAMLISGDSSTEAISAMREASLHVLLKPVLPLELHLLVERLLTHGDEATAVEPV